MEYYTVMKINNLTFAYSIVDGSHKHNAEKNGLSVEHTWWSIYIKYKKAKVTHAVRLRIIVKPHREGEDRDMDEGNFQNVINNLFLNLGVFTEVFCVSECIKHPTYDTCAFLSEEYSSIKKFKINTQKWQRKHIWHCPHRDYSLIEEKTFQQKSWA